MENCKCLVDELICKCDEPVLNNRSECKKCGLVFIGNTIISCNLIHDPEPPPKRCCDFPNMIKGRATRVCTNCGSCSIPVYTQYQGFGFTYKKRSVHSRTRWFRNMVINYVKDFNDQTLLINDFQTLARVYEKYNLLKGRNISIYGYYINRLARRRGIKLTSIPRTVKSPSARELFDERYETACKILGW